MSQAYTCLEGLIETDRWFGPLFINIKLLRTDHPIYFRTDHPYMQVQPIHRAHYDDALLNAYTVESGPEALTEQDWDAFHRTIVVPNSEPDRRLGHYAVSVSRAEQAGCPMLSHLNDD